ncbi:membrane protein [Mannheimia granulomatis]|uniref:Membrane protein n=1 Tax=Mannheimia granulomatis TaxID=85402 RepID=A0A011NFV9_9PAST|nr:YeeE/YedE family protein [Mannheimia granulomatis]EXI63275.1 membrane protein [Mannheimia granulomatis]RGE49100.1 membrane protein [Mannheimia granulomatis]
MFWSFFSALLIGGLLGFVFQRSRFCLTGGFRDIYLLKNNRMFYALLIAISVQSIGVVSLIELGFIASPYKDFSLPATIIGSLIFGMSIILASGCATGTWYHAGEGLISAWIALVMYMVSAAAMRFGALSEFTKSMMQYGKMEENLSAIFGVPIGLLVGILVIVTAILVYRTLSKPALKVAALPPKWTGLRHYLFEKRYHPFFAAVLIGLLAFAAWGANAISGKSAGLGITGPSANIVRYIVTGDAKLINWGVFLVLGIMLGSYIAAKGSKEFKWRMPDLTTCRNSVIGGLLMGVGASLAGGCTIGNGLTATAVMSAKGWISLFFIMIGVWIMTYFVYIRPTKQAQ